jgi:methylmalonyl-CoA mutase, C-terminal domain
MIKGLDHIAIAVKSLDDNVKFYRDTFGIGEPVKLEVIEDQGVRACLLPLGNCFIELLEPTDPNGTVARFIEREGEKLHHICLETDNVTDELQRMADKGLDLVDRTPRHGLAGMIGFLHPRSTRGILTELVQKIPEGGAAAAAMQGRQIRILVAKPGLDGHDRGAKVVARALRDAGMEVIYTGIRQSPEMIAEAALQEDVDAVGLSVLSGAHMELCPRVITLLKQSGMDDVVVFLGGIIPDDDIPTLKEIGIAGVFGPGTSTKDIIEFVRATVPVRK